MDRQAVREGLRALLVSILIVGGVVGAFLAVQALGERVYVATHAAR